MLKSAWQQTWLITENITPPSLCIHLHGNIVTVRAVVGNGGKIGYKMDRFVVNFELFASASVWGGQQQGQAGSEQGAWDKHAGMSYQQTGTPRESVPWNDQGYGETNVRHPEWQQRWEVCRECLSAKSFFPPQQLHLQKTTIA